eukprot:357937-Chlamydomonas_euryale.AAC.7
MGACHDNMRRIREGMRGLADLLLGVAAGGARGDHPRLPRRPQSSDEMATRRRCRSGGRGGLKHSAAPLHEAGRDGSRPLRINLDGWPWLETHAHTHTRTRTHTHTHTHASGRRV